jgi:hypothetical protein
MTLSFDSSIYDAPKIGANRLRAQLIRPASFSGIIAVRFISVQLRSLRWSIIWPIGAATLADPKRHAFDVRK